MQHGFWNLTSIEGFNKAVFLTDWIGCREPN